MDMVVDYDAWQKLQLAPLTSFNPQVLQGLKYSQHSGYLLELERLYSTMYLEWSTLKKDVSDMTEAVAGLTWTVVPFCRDGGEPEALAKEVAKVVSDALWRVSAQRPGEFSHCFTELLGSMVHALYRSVNVHEVVWRNTPELVFPLEYKQLGPQYYMWETRQGEPDRLMLVPDGMDYSRPVPFEPGRFVVALNTTGPDHPMYNADFYSLVGYFVAAKFGLPGLQSFVKRYGHPLRKFTIEDERKRRELEARLRALPDVYDVFLGPGEALEVTAIPAGANVPHEVLLRVAENACHQLIKGNTLTSDVGDKGGSRAQAEVHMGVEASLVRKRGEFVARVLNRQLVPYIVQRNYGRMDLPMPELRCMVPEQKVNVQRAQYWKEVLAIPGMRVLRSAVHDDLGLAVPGEGDEVYAAPEDVSAAPMPTRRMPEGEPEVGMAAKAPQEGGKGALRERAERLVPVAMRRWAGPTIERFEGMLRAGVKPQEVLRRIGELQPDTRALADAMCAVTEAGLGVPGDGEGVRAEHCNQFRHVQGCGKELGAELLPLPMRRGPEVLKVPREGGVRFFAEWMSRFGSGVRTRVGDVVGLDGRTLGHVLEHNEREAVWRLRHLPLVVETLRNPAEVWQGFRGNKVHIARFRVGERPRVVVVVSHGRRVVTFYAEQIRLDDMERYRCGKLLYKREEPAT